MEGKVALITGSTAGIGLAIARALAARKCHVIIHGRRTEAEAIPLLENIKRDFGVESSYVRFNLTKVDEIEDHSKAILEKHGKIDILVNNAGINRVGGVTELPLEQWQEIINVNMTSPFLLTKYLLPNMKKAGWGRIINIGTVFSHIGYEDILLPCYTATKHALYGFTKAVALEVAGSGITCNIICPGSTQTEMFEKHMKIVQQERGFATYDEAVNWILGNLHPSKQPVKTEQLGETAAFLCSPAADQITGTSINVDGGCLAR